MAGTNANNAGGESNVVGRPFLSIHFACCGTYSRIYRTADGKHYAGHCPRCARPVRIGVGAGGTSARTFTVS